MASIMLSTFPFVMELMTKVSRTFLFQLCPRLWKVTNRQLSFFSVEQILSQETGLVAPMLQSKVYWTWNFQEPYSQTNLCKFLLLNFHKIIASTLIHLWTKQVGGSKFNWKEKKHSPRLWCQRINVSVCLSFQTLTSSILQVLFTS